MTQGSNTIRRYNVLGSRRLSNYWWATVILLGSLGFFITGLSSFSKSSFLPFVPFQSITFFPQGLVMSFYGVLGILFSSYLWFAIFCNIGSGFNEINKKERLVRIFRWGFPGKNRRIDLSYPIADIEAVKLELKEGINSKRTVYIRLKPVSPSMAGGSMATPGHRGGGHRTPISSNEVTKSATTLPFQTSPSNPLSESQKLGWTKSPSPNKGLTGFSQEKKKGKKSQKIGLNFKKDEVNNTKRDIPLNRIDQRMTLQETEQEASELARFLQVSLELN